MQFEKINVLDLEEVAKLQPEGWSEIKTKFQFYIENEFCTPYKMTIDNAIVGVGCNIVFKRTAWLAHIIVGKDFRNRGIGFKLVRNLLDKLEGNKSVRSVLLIATKMGEPIYFKADFREVSQYVQLNRKEQWKVEPPSGNVVSYEKEYYQQIIKLDKTISGEDREPLIQQFLFNSKVYVESNQVQGFYLPSLGDGLIFADNNLAGIELMKYKYSTIDKAIIPSENKTAINFLTQNGFSQAIPENKRMVFGEDLNWQAEKFYSRIGGNFG